MTRTQAEKITFWAFFLAYWMAQIPVAQTFALAKAQFPELGIETMVRWVEELNQQWMCPN